MTEPALRFLSLGIELTKEDAGLLEGIHAALDRLTRRRKSSLSVSSRFTEEVLREVLLYFPGILQANDFSGFFCDAKNDRSAARVRESG